MIKISDVHAIITVSLLQYIYIGWGGGNIQNAMLANPEYNKNSFYNYSQERLHTFTLESCSFITSSLTLVYLEVIINLQCHICTRKQLFYFRGNTK